jgi:hypothetical protein
MGNHLLYGNIPSYCSEPKSDWWMSIFRGFWSHEWLVAHIAHVRSVPLRDPKHQETRNKHQDRWLNSVLRFVMRKCHQLWKLRNNERHGVTPAGKASALRIFFSSLECCCTSCYDYTYPGHVTREMCGSYGSCLGCRLVGRVGSLVGCHVP